MRIAREIFAADMFKILYDHYVFALNLLIFCSFFKIIHSRSHLILFGLYAHFSVNRFSVDVGILFYFFFFINIPSVSVFFYIILVEMTDAAT